jgi:hypothetical protein
VHWSSVMTFLRAQLQALVPPSDPADSSTYGHLPARLQELFRAACEPTFSGVIYEFFRERPRAEGNAAGGAAPTDESAAREEAAASAASAADDGAEPPPSGTNRSADDRVPLDIWAARVAAHAESFRPVVPPPITDSSEVALLAGGAMIDHYSVEICCHAIMPQIETVPLDDEVQSSWAAFLRGSAPCWRTP